MSNTDWGFPDPWSLEEQQAMRDDVAILLGYDPTESTGALPERCHIHGTWWPHPGDLMPECPACIAEDTDLRRGFRDTYHDRY